MALIQPTRGPEYWAVEDAGEIIVAGTTVVGQATATAPIYPVYRGAYANTFLGTVRGKARRDNPLPDCMEMVGIWSSWRRRTDETGRGRLMRRSCISSIDLSLWRDDACFPLTQCPA